MKKIVSLIFTGSLIFGSVNAQILNEQNVTLNMDIQPVLQLMIEGPTQHEFVFDDIKDYYAGIVKYGANILKVSASVKFDLWAAGLSQQTDRVWDPVYDYAGGAGATGATSVMPLTALELRQFPANPMNADAAVAGTNCGVAGQAPSAQSDYSSPFVQMTDANTPLATGSNVIYTPGNATPYAAPNDMTALAEEKYIAGSEGVTANCGVAPGSYLQESNPVSNGTNDGYYFVMDYRLIPGLPALFPMHLAASNTNTNEFGIAAAVATTAAAGLTAALGGYVAPGVYSMYIKYIITEDQ
jgi:hypothetical protein